MNPTATIAQAHANATGTEAAAQRRAALGAGTVRGRLLTALAAHGDHGLTAIEATTALGYDLANRYSVAPRFPELVRMGYAIKTTTSREDCAVYVVTPAGTAWANSTAAA